MDPRILRSGAFAAFAAALSLVIQFVIGLGIGNDFALISKSLDAARMTQFFQSHASALTALMTADDAFATAYALAFIVLALDLMPRAKSLAMLALGLSLLTAFTDLAENSLMLAGIQTAVQTQTLDANVLVLLFWLGQMKYLAIYPAALLYAIALWDSERTGKILALLFVLFPLIGILSIALDALRLAQGVWMLVLLLAGGIFLWRQASEKTAQV